MSETNQTETTGTLVRCKHCQSQNVRKYGFVDSVQTYFCNDCRRKFKSDDRLFRMKIPYPHVATALDDYYKGKSIAEICDGIGRHIDRPSTRTVYEWVRKYTDEAVEQFKDYHPDIGNVLIADETVLELDGKNWWCIDIIDEKTRFLLATKLSPNREGKDIQDLLRTVQAVAGKAPKRILTDGWRGYIDAIEQVFGADAKHIQTDPFGKDDNTELIERWHGTLKDRTKVMRGLKNPRTAEQFLAGYLVFYNYLRPHEFLDGKTPAEAAGVKYTVRTWGDVCRFAEPQVQVLVTPAKVDILSEHKPLVRPISRRRYDVDKKREQRKAHRRETRRAQKSAPTTLSEVRQNG